ncbi:MAG: aspartate aminotransferase family protein [Deltaproteobacteria bacterium]|nr:aspartate aminotransferase family protein [Deltaproteobacteria bacterium]
MDANTIRAKHKQFLFPNVSNFYSESLVPVKAQGMSVWDSEGKKYLDFFAGILTVSVGHCNPKVVEETAAQLRTLGHVSTLYPTEPIVRMAEKMASLAPAHPAGWKLMFTSSGSEANETSILTAKVATGAQDMIALRHSYGGRTATALNMMGHKSYRPRGSEIPGIKHAHAPYCYRCDFGLTYPSCEMRCAKDIETLIQTETSGAVACFIAEPIMGVGGFITPPKEYFQVAVPIIKKYGGLFIADEVQTGFGRTGNHMWGIDNYGVTPDIMSFAKGIANGAPVGATMAKAELADKQTYSSIATFGGNPVSMIQALATLSVIENERLVENSKVVGGYLRDGLNALAERFTQIGEVRGMGLMQALELVKDRKTKEPDPQGANRLMEATRKRGLLIGKGGLYGNVMRIAPPMIATKGDVDDALKILGESLGESATA